MVELGELGREFFGLVVGFGKILRGGRLRCVSRAENSGRASLGGSVAEPIRVSCYNSEGKPRMLDLFSGTILPTAAFRKRVYEVIKLDSDQKFS